jgi:hypothetical protein
MLKFYARAKVSVGAAVLRTAGPAPVAAAAAAPPAAQQQQQQQQPPEAAGATAVAAPAAAAPARLQQLRFPLLTDTAPPSRACYFARTLLDVIFLRTPSRRAPGWAERRAPLICGSLRAAKSRSCQISQGSETEAVVGGGSRKPESG